MIHVGSVGQTTLEATLFYDQLPAETRSVVWVLMPSSNAAFELGTQRITNFTMNGYQPSARASAAIEAAYGHEVLEILKAPAALQRFRSRWVAHQWLDVGARRLLRNDIAHEVVATNLSFPAPFPGSLPGADRRARIQRRSERTARDGLSLAAADQLLIWDVVADAALTGRKLVLVLPPQHPRVAAAAPESSIQVLSELLHQLSKADHVAGVDASRALPSSEFYDDMHPTLKGAARLTTLVARALKGLD